MMMDPEIFRRCLDALAVLAEVRSNLAVAGLQSAGPTAEKLDEMIAGLVDELHKAKGQIG